MEQKYRVVEKFNVSLAVLEEYLPSIIYSYYLKDKLISPFFKDGSEVLPAFSLLSIRSTTITTLIPGQGKL